MKLFICIQFFSILLIHCDASFPCERKNGQSQDHFGNLTPYDKVRGDFVNENECPAVQIWMLIRHGTRYYEREEVRNMKKAIYIQKEIALNRKSSRANGLCEGDSLAIEKWSWDRRGEKRAGELSEVGRSDQIGLARRYKSRYPKLLGEYSPREFHLRHTEYNRTRDSCGAFADELFGKGSHGCGVMREMLMPFTACERFMNNALSEYRGFANFSNAFQRLRRAVSDRLGYDRARTLLGTEIRGLYDNCRFGRALAGSSPWCSAFSRDDFKILEYWGDLMFFYYSGPGRNYSAELGCSPLKHLRETFAETVRDGDGRVTGNRVVTMFGHDVVIDAVLTALGYNYDGGRILPADDYDDSVAGRKYRTSLNLPSAANVVAVLHRCESGKFTVQLLLNEKPMELVGCPRGLCTWDAFASLLKFAAKCNYANCHEK